MIIRKSSRNSLRNYSSFYPIPGNLTWAIILIRIDWFISEIYGIKSPLMIKLTSGLSRMHSGITLSKESKRRLLTIWMDGFNLLKIFSNLRLIRGSSKRRQDKQGCTLWNPGLSMSRSLMLNLLLKPFSRT